MLWIGKEYSSLLKVTEKYLYPFIIHRNSPKGTHSHKQALQNFYIPIYLDTTTRIIYQHNIWGKSLKTPMSHPPCYVLY